MKEKLLKDIRKHLEKQYNRKLTADEYSMIWDILCHLEDEIDMTIRILRPIHTSGVAITEEEVTEKKLK